MADQDEGGGATEAGKALIDIEHRVLDALAPADCMEEPAVYAAVWRHPGDDLSEILSDLDRRGLVTQIPDVAQYRHSDTPFPICHRRWSLTEMGKRALPR